VNYSYPCPDAAHARNALARWGNPSNKNQYNSQSQAKITARLKRFAAKFGIGEKSEEEDEEYIEFEEGNQDVSKPMPNNHVCEINSGLKIVGQGKRNHNGKSYNVLYGKKDGGGSKEASYHYPIGTWTADEARSHCGSHDGHFIAATGGKSVEEVEDKSVIEDLLEELTKKGARTSARDKEQLRQAMAVLQELLNEQELPEIEESKQDEENITEKEGGDIEMSEETNNELKELMKGMADSIAEGFAGLAKAFEAAKPIDKIAETNKLKEELAVKDAEKEDILKRLALLESQPLPRKMEEPQVITRSSPGWSADIPGQLYSNSNPIVAKEKVEKDFQRFCDKTAGETNASWESAFAKLNETKPNGDFVKSQAERDKAILMLRKWKRAQDDTAQEVDGAVIWRKDYNL
jgi:hypothetical protein